MGVSFTHFFGSSYLLASLTYSCKISLTYMVRRCTQSLRRIFNMSSFFIFFLFTTIKELVMNVLSGLSASLGVPLLVQIFAFLLVFLLSSFYLNHFLLWALVVVGALGLITGSQTLFFVLGAVALFLYFPNTRKLLTGQVMTILDKLKIMPQISETEKIALEAGSTWIDAELFSGSPDFTKNYERAISRPFIERKIFH